MTTMASAVPLRKDQADTYFRAQIQDRSGNAVDVSGATTLQLKFRNPDTDEVTTKTAAFSTKATHAGDGTDGWVEYKDVDAELAVAEGVWKYWGRCVIGTDGPFMSTTLSYVVTAEGAG